MKKILLLAIILVFLSSCEKNIDIDLKDQAASLVVDGQRIPAGATSQPFTWNGATAHQASLAYNSAEALQFQGPWALFQLVATAQVTRVGATLQLEFPLEVSGRQLRLPDGTPEVVRFEISGPGAAVLAPMGLYGGSCVNPVTK